jgi:RsiW-degrading membrane proteinase PrsW (M82 family)
MNELAEIEGAQASDAIGRSARAQVESGPLKAKARWQVLFSVPLALVIALALHWSVAKKEPTGETVLYAYFLGGLLVASFGAAALQTLWSGLREWMRAACPLIAVAVFFLAGWEHDKRSGGSF